MEEIKSYLQLDRFQQPGFLYPLIFQEYIYGLAHDFSLNRSRLLENPGYDNKYSLLLVKRLIIRMYGQNHFIIFANDSNKTNKNRFFGRNKNFYPQTISEAFAFIVEIPFAIRLISSQDRKRIFKSHNLRSIHSLFPFLENNFSHFNYLLDILIPRAIHLEILIQTLRYWVKDASALHLLRLFFHEYWSWNTRSATKKPHFSFSPKKIKDIFSYYIILMHMNTNPFWPFSVTNLLICDQHLLYSFLNNSFFMEKKSVFSKSFLRIFRLVYGCSQILSCIMLGIKENLFWFQRVHPF